MLCGRETKINYRDSGRGARKTQQIKDIMTEMEKGVVSGKVRQQTQVMMKDESDKERVVSNNR